MPGRPQAQPLAMQAEEPAALPAAEAEARAEQPEQQEQQPPTSRICVKNLPKYVDDHRLREHFAARGEVTDAKIMRTRWEGMHTAGRQGAGLPGQAARLGAGAGAAAAVAVLHPALGACPRRDGKSRCFGFVGFRSPTEAEAAVKYFNKSFFDTMRLVVEVGTASATLLAACHWLSSVQRSLAAQECSRARIQHHGGVALLPSHGRLLRLACTNTLLALPPSVPRQFAYKFGGSEAPRAWSKYTAGTSANKRLTAPEKTGANSLPLGGAGEGGGAEAGKKGKKGKKKEALPEEGEHGWVWERQRGPVYVRACAECRRARCARGLACLLLSPSSVAAGPAVPAPGTSAPVAKLLPSPHLPWPPAADPKLREFMQIMQPRSKQAIWTNDDLLPPGSAAAQQAQQQQAGRRPASGEEDDEGGSDEEYEDLPAAAGAAATPSSSRGGGGGSDADEEDDDEEEEGQQRQAEDGVVRDAAVTDLDYLRSRMRASFDDDDDAFAAGGAAGTAAGGSDEGEGDEEGSELASGSGSEGGQQADDAAGPSGSELEEEEAEPAAAAAAARQRKARRRAADAADDELDAIFGGGSKAGGSDSEGADAAGEEEGEGEDADMAEAGSDADAEGVEAEDDGGRQQAGAAAGAAVVHAGDDASIADTGRLFVRNLPYTGERDRCWALECCTRMCLVQPPPGGPPAWPGCQASSAVPVPWAASKALLPSHFCTHAPACPPVRPPACQLAPLLPGSPITFVPLPCKCSHRGRPAAAI